MTLLLFRIAHTAQITVWQIKVVSFIKFQTKPINFDKNHEIGWNIFYLIPDNTYKIN